MLCQPTCLSKFILIRLDPNFALSSYYFIYMIVVFLKIPFFRGHVGQHLLNIVLTRSHYVRMPFVDVYGVSEVEAMGSLIWVYFEILLYALFHVMATTAIQSVHSPVVFGQEVHIWLF